MYLISKDFQILQISKYTFITKRISQLEFQSNAHIFMVTEYWLAPTFLDKMLKLLILPCFISGGDSVQIVQVQLFAIHYWHM